MKRIQSTQRQQQGFTLVEMGVVAAIVAALLIAVFMLLPKVKQERLLASGRQEVPLVVTALRAAFINQTSTTGLTTSLAQGFGAFPGRITSGTGMTGPKGATWVEYVFDNKTLASPMVTKAGGGIVYWMSGVPASLCLPMMQLLAAQPGVAMVYAGTGTPSGTLPASMIAGAAKVNASGLVLDVASAGKACKATSTQVAAIIAI